MVCFQPRPTAPINLGAVNLVTLVPDGWPAWTGVAALVLNLVLVVAGVALVSVNRRPSAAIAWVLTIFLVPVVGLLAFFVIGSRRLPRRRRQRQRFVDEAIRASTVDEESEHVADERLAGLTRLGQRLGAMPVVGGSSVDLVEEGGGIAAMARGVDAAERFVHLEFYLVALDATTEPLFGAMQRAAARGVTVRVLFDHLASLRSPGYRAMRRRLTADGVLARPMLPLWPTTREWLRPDLRNHRKLLVVDGIVGFTGSQNVVDPSYNKRANVRKGLRWVDLMARVEGPAVTELAGIFRTDWFSETGDALIGEVADAAARRVDPRCAQQVQLLPSGPGFPTRNNLRVFTGLVHAARRELVVVSPYFVPEEALMLAITSAAQRGVDVELFVCEKGDQWLVHHAQRSYYPDLLAAGVKIWLYPSPAVLHTKLVRVDDEVVAFGSSNLDIRSFELNLELTTLVLGEGFVRRIGAVEDAYRARSTRLDADAERSWPVMVADNLARLASAIV